MFLWLDLWASEQEEQHCFVCFCTSVFFVLWLVKFLFKGRLEFSNIFLVKLPNICIHSHWLKQIMIWTWVWLPRSINNSISHECQSAQQWNMRFPNSNSWQAQTRKLNSRKLLINEHKSLLKTVLNRIKGTGHRLFYFRHEREIVCCTCCCLSKLVYKGEGEDSFAFSQHEGEDSYSRVPVKACVCRRTVPVQGTRCTLSNPVYTQKDGQLRTRDSLPNPAHD